MEWWDFLLWFVGLSPPYVKIKDQDKFAYPGDGVGILPD